jgi:hypothetical protein
MLARLLLDAIAVTAASVAVFVASVQVERHELPEGTKWALLLVLIVVVAAASINTLQSIPTR